MSTINKTVCYNAGPAYSGLASSVLMTITDTSGTVHSPAVAVTEAVDYAGAGIGQYLITFAADFAWVPGVITVTVTGQAGLGAVFPLTAGDLATMDALGNVRAVPQSLPASIVTPTEVVILASGS